MHLVCGSAAEFGCCSFMVDAIVYAVGNVASSVALVLVNKRVRHTAARLWCLCRLAAAMRVASVSTLCLPCGPCASALTARHARAACACAMPVPPHR